MKCEGGETKPNTTTTSKQRGESILPELCWLAQQALCTASTSKPTKGGGGERRAGQHGNVGIVREARAGKRESRRAEGNIVRNVERKEKQSKKKATFYLLPPCQRGCRCLPWCRQHGVQTAGSSPSGSCGWSARLSFPSPPPRTNQPPQRIQPCPSLCLSFSLFAQFFSTKNYRSTECVRAGLWLASCSCCLARRMDPALYKREG